MQQPLVYIARKIPDEALCLIASACSYRMWESEWVHGATLGIVGMGRIGKAVVGRTRGFGMRGVRLRRSPDAPDR